MDHPRAIEHRQGRTAVLLREQRLKLVLSIALVEGILVLLGAIEWWTVLAVAVVAVALYWLVGRGHRNATLREGSWIAAFSQLVVVLVPVLAAVLTMLAIVALVLVALGALVLLLLDRR